MYKRSLLTVLLCSAVFAFARDKPETWLEVRSPHFVVVSNSTEKQSRQVADQFERMRSVFHSLFPNLRIDPPTPIVVLAIKNEADFRALEPTAYLAKGQLKLGGLFLRGPDKNYVLMRLDAEGDHPYAVIYHEYTHLLLSKIDRLPLWLNEGLAEFYQNTEIREKLIELGQPSSENLLLLRQEKLLPLAMLFAVDQSSPYYHQENKGSIFYAEAWVLTHYLEVNDFKAKTHRVADYMQLLNQNTDAVTAANRAFGDLKELQAALEEYIGQKGFQYFKIPSTTDIDDSTFTFRELPLPRADAVRADFLAYNQRTADARALLSQVLRQDPDNVLAHETMGFLEFSEKHLDKARKWYAEAVKLDSQSFLAHYYFAAITMKPSMDAVDDAQIEKSLRASIKLNPDFAPSYDQLAVFLVTRHGNLEEARMMALNAVQLEPENMGYRMNMANVLLQMKRGNDAVAVIRNALHLAKSPEESAAAGNFLLSAQQYAKAQDEEVADSIANDESEEGVTTTAVNSTSTVVIPDEESIPDGPHHFITGLLKNVHCNMPALDLRVVAGGKALEMHANNYLKIEYKLKIQRKKDLNPCADLEGRPAKVEYVESADKTARAIVAIEVNN
jgi:Tfp pilus assembly protein PilF